MDQAELACGVCEECYARERLPRNLNCGHSICTPCLEQIIVLDKKCPECRSEISVVQALSLPVNYPILRLATSSIKSRAESSPGVCPSSNRCKIHNAILEFRCRECSLWICQECVSSNHLEPPIGKCKIIPECEAIKEFKDSYMLKLRRDTSRVEETIERLACKIRMTSRMQSKNENEIKRLEDQIKELNLSQEMLQLKQTQSKTKQSGVKELLKMMNQSVELIGQVSSLNEMLIANETVADRRVKFEQIMLLENENDPYEDIACILENPVKSEAEKKQVLLNMLKTERSVYTILTWKDVPLWSQVTLENNRVHLHALEYGHPPEAKLNLPFEELRKLVPKESSTVFMDVGWEGQSRGHVYIRMFEDTPRGRQTTYLCSGERGHSYKNTVLYSITHWSNGTLKSIRGGDYEHNDGTGGCAIVEGITNGGKYRHKITAGLLVGWPHNEHFRLGSFDIYLNDNLQRVDLTAHGIVTEGLETLRLAAQCKPVSLAKVMDCGLVITP